MLHRALAIVRTLVAIFASRADLILENLALRRQLAVLRRKHPSPRVRSALLAGLLAQWEEETVLEILGPDRLTD